jgi:hypothetical protein
MELELGIMLVGDCNCCAAPHPYMAVRLSDRAARPREESSVSGSQWSAAKVHLSVRSHELGAHALNCGVA